MEVSGQLHMPVTRKDLSEEPHHEDNVWKLCGLLHVLAILPL